MYTGLFHTHSGLRYIVLVLLLIVILKSLAGLTAKKPFQSIDNKLSLWLLISTHIQFVVGLVLYFVSPFVQFSAETMKNASTRYWTVEHLVGMLAAVVLITVARISSKRMNDNIAKHKRLFMLNSIALVVIVVTIALSGRKIFYFF
jgi:L-cystine uptake protein TcyP (sodium:dicarboxylate symporter family)